MILLPRGEAIRNFAYSGILGRLSQSAEVLVLSVLPNEEVSAVLRAAGSAVRELVEVREAYPPRLCRELLNMAHGRWLWSEAGKHRWERREAEAGSLKQRLKLRLKRLLAIPLARPGGIRLLESLERTTTRLFRPTEDYIRLFREWKPDLVFNGSHVHGASVRVPLEAAATLGIPTAAFLFSWDNLTSQGRIVPRYDSYLAWTGKIKRQLLEIYPDIAPQSVHVVGTPQFDVHYENDHALTRDEFCLTIGADPARPIVLYTTGMPNHMPGEEVIVEHIADFLAAMPSRPQLLLRVYAKDTSGRFNPLIARRPDILAPPVAWERRFLTPLPADGPMFSNMLRHCDLGINAASTVSIELCMFHKPVINVAFDPPGMNIYPCSYRRFYDYDHYAPVVRSGAVHMVESLHLMPAAIADCLAHPLARAAQQDALLRDLFEECLGGGSAAKVAACLLDLATERN